MSTKFLHQADRQVRSFRQCCLVVTVAMLWAIAVMILRPSVTSAATSSTVNFQARLEQSNGSIAPDGNYNVEFKLYSAASGGTAEWTEDYTYNSGAGGTDARLHVANGYLTVSLGSLCPFTPGTCQGYTETSIDWSQQQWLTMNIGGTGSTGSFPTMGDGEMSPRLQLTAVPYAFQAGSAAQLSVNQGTFSGILNFATLSGGNQTFQLPNEGAAGTYSLLTKNQADAGYIQLQAGSPPGTPQTGNFNISGTGIAGAFQAGSLDTASAAALGLGQTNATAVNIGNTTTNILTTLNGTVLVKPTSGHDSTTAFQVQTAGGTGLLTADTTNLKVSIIGNISDLFSATPGLQQVSSTTTSATNPMWVAVQGKYAYVVEGGGTATLQIFDVSNIAAPSSAGTLPLSTTSPTQIKVQGKYAYISEQGTSNAGELEIVDISNPSAPTSVGTIVTVTNGGPFGVDVSGNYVYVVDSATSDLTIVDIAAPAAPKKIATLATNTSPRKVYVRGNYAYIVSFGGTPKLQVVNVSNPASPTIVGSVTLNNNGDDVSVQGKYAYVTEYSTGTPTLDVVNVSNPASPTIVTSKSGAQYEYANVVSGRYLFTSGYNWANDLGVVDVSNPASPALLQTYTTNLNLPAGMALSGRYLFLANKSANNLLILDISGLETTSAMIHSLEAGNLQVDTNAAVANSLSVGGGLGVGQGGIYSAGGISASGPTTISTAINSSAAFRVQNASGSQVLGADTSLGQVLFGAAGSLGGTLVLYNSTNTNAVTITTGVVSAPYSLVLPTAVGTTGQCLQANVSGSTNSLAWGSCGGNNTVTVLLTPTYANAVLDAANDTTCASANSGTMTSGLDLTNRMNYYKWTTTSGSNQCYDVVVQVPIPSNFSSWAANPLSITTYTSDTTNGTINMEVRDSTGSVQCNYASVTPASTATWTTNNSACTLGTGTYTAGGYMTIRVRLTSPNGGDVRIGNIVLKYVSSF